MKTPIYAAPAVKGLTLKPMSATTVVLNVFYQPFKLQLSGLLGTKCVFNPCPAMPGYIRG